MASFSIPVSTWYQFLEDNYPEYLRGDRSLRLGQVLFYYLKMDKMDRDQHGQVMDTIYEFNGTLPQLKSLLTDYIDDTQ